MFIPSLVCWTHCVVLLLTESIFVQRTSRLIVSSQWNGQNVDLKSFPKNHANKRISALICKLNVQLLAAIFDFSDKAWSIWFIFNEKRPTFGGARWKFNSWSTKWRLIWLLLFVEGGTVTAFNYTVVRPNKKQILCLHTFCTEWHRII